MRPISPSSTTASTVKILGHRGARGEQIENTPTALLYACQLIPQGLAGIEFDVQLTADGQLAIFHDDTLQRLLGQQARLDQLTLNEIRRRQSSQVPILALNDMLLYPTVNLEHGLISSDPQRENAILASYDSLGRRRTTTRYQPAEWSADAAIAATKQHTLFNAMQRFQHIELEIKTHSRTRYRLLLAAMTDSLLQHGLQHLPIMLTSFDHTFLALLANHRILAHIPRGLLVEDARMLPDLPNRACQLGCTRVGVHYQLLTPKLIAACQRVDLAVSAWTVNDLQIAKQLISAGVDVVITDYPSQFLQQLQR